MFELIMNNLTLIFSFVPLMIAYVVRTELKAAGTVMNIKGKDVTVCTAYGHTFTLK
jgi:hypothetical protein